MTVREYQIGKNFVNTEGERITRKGKRIFVNALETHEDIGTLARLIRWILHNPQTRNVVLYFPKHYRVFPNAIVPLACMINHLHNIGVKVTIHNDVEDLAESHFESPLSPSKHEDAITSNASGVVWKYSTSSELAFLLDRTIEYLTRKLICKSGVLLALEWCLNEILDNVFQHARVRSGFFMFQIQQERRRLSFSVADQGIGILRSFSKSRYRPSLPTDAITLALQRGVTTNDECQGNGLWGVSEIITQNRGQMTISSSGGAIYYNRQSGVIKSFETVQVLNQEYPGTTIDVQLDASRSINLLEAFAGNYEPVDLRIENMENAQGFIVLPLKKASVGTGTRESGKDMRVYVQNLLLSTSQPVMIDFAGIGMVSSSYADEFLGKLYREIGPKVVGERIRFTTMTDTVKLIVSNAVAIRCAQNT